ncbi:hypothetical protein V5O48_018790 [Marasmius crinis-equi]|uniref:DUF659 domain-containing protein n=1 Tax=Marasmius crinis-equi TaxID=585013 RepID=A0ABR3EK63_9AGAR
MPVYSPSVLPSPTPSVPPSPTPSFSTLAPSDSMSNLGTPVFPSHLPRRTLQRSVSTPALTPGPLLGDITLLQPWTEERTRRYNFLIAAMTADAGFALRWTENPFFQMLCAEFIPYAPVISRLTLTQKLLKEFKLELRSQVKEEVEGCNAILQNDGWTGKNHHHLSAFMIAVAAKRVYAEVVETYKVEIVGLVTDAGGDGRKACRLFAREFPSVIVLDCFAHQVNLIVTDFFKSGGDGLLEYASQAVTLISWLRKKSGVMASLSLAVLVAVVTRWTTHYQAFSRLLKLKGELDAIITVDRADPKIVFIGNESQRQHAEEMVRPVRDDRFWRALVRLTSILEPLAIAANTIQGADG